MDTQGSGAATASEEIGQFAGERFPKLFAQVSVEGESVVVHRVRTDGSPLDTAVRKQFPAHPVRFADAPRSATELDALTRRVVDDHRTLKAEGIRVDAVGPDYVRGIVIVNVENPASARTALTERYGKALRVSAPGPDVLPAG
ncbi:hypothetical protein ACPEIF_18095 [Streptomyces sp. NPDC012600]|uniref:hypothetical protein n=1 Tax=Streptomyces sp. NPDC012600 TaxID=3415005 RepID=UPI003C2D0E24